MFQDREIKLTPQQYLAQRLKNKDNRFEQCTPYVFAAAAFVEEKQMERNIGVSYTLGDSCHIWQYFKVSIKLRTLAVLWTHFCVDKTADLSSFMDTFSMSRILPDLGSFVDTFRLSELKITKTADLSSLWTLFGCLNSYLSQVSTKLRTLAVLWTLFGSQ